MDISMSDFQSEKRVILDQIAKTPNNSEAMLTLAKLYLTQGMLSEAKELLRVVTELHPNSPELQNNMGAILFRQKFLEEAYDCFVQALNLKPDYFDAMYNLALVFKAQKKDEDAAASLLAILSANPGHAQAYLLLGKIFLERKQFDRADQWFQEAIHYHPEDADLFESIVVNFLMYDRVQEAKPYCEKLLKLKPGSPNVLYDLGVISTRLHEPERAKNYYLAVLKINPNHFATLNNLAVLYLEQQNFAAAKFYFEQALTHDPENQSIQYSLHAISGGKQFGDAPKAYIQSLFDSYSSHYEIHLTEGLEYVVPQTLKQIVSEKLNPLAAQWKILDLGCGTGLCGHYFKEYATNLMGVDLSPKMIELAKGKGCYDELIEAENSEYLSKQKDRFNLILAADVFIYQGDLWKILIACFKALAGDGLLAFSVEINKEDGFALQKTGRFSHAKSYIEALASKIGFKILVSEIHNTRIQRTDQLQGYYFILQK